MMASSAARLRYLEQALGLVEETRVLERHAHGAGEGGKQADIRFAEGILTVKVLKRDDAFGFTADEHRHIDN